MEATASPKVPLSSFEKNAHSLMKLIIWSNQVYKWKHTNKVERVAWRILWLCWPAIEQFRVSDDEYSVGTKYKAGKEKKQSKCYGNVSEGNGTIIKVSSCGVFRLLNNSSTAR